MIEITHNIANVEVIKSDTGVNDSNRWQEVTTRPDVLSGKTHKITPPTLNNAIYVTINDICINEGTELEQCRPFEIFIQSKDQTHGQWFLSLSLMITAIFRKSEDITFIIEQLKGVQDPNGGYFKTGGGGWVPSLVWEIADVIEKHFQNSGLLPIMEESNLSVTLESTGLNPTFNGETCPKCYTPGAYIRSEGCYKCLNCGYSKCG